jgi:hypothetical protein
MNHSYLKLLILALFISILPIGTKMIHAVANALPPKVVQNGVVPDEATAIAIAEAVLIPVYGKDKILSERPFKAKLEKGVWTVYGFLPEGWIGGTAQVKIDKAHGAILGLTHYQ